MYWYSFSSTIEAFFYRHNIYSQTFLFKVDFFTANILSSTIPDLAKFKDISRTWKMNLLFSRMCENPV